MKELQVHVQRVLPATASLQEAQSALGIARRLQGVFEHIFNSVKLLKAALWLKYARMDTALCLIACARFQTGRQLSKGKHSLAEAISLLHVTTPDAPLNTPDVCLELSVAARVCILQSKTELALTCAQAAYTATCTLVEDYPDSVEARHAKEVCSKTLMQIG